MSERDLKKKVVDNFLFRFYLQFSATVEQIIIINYFGKKDKSNPNKYHPDGYKV
jgi:hypothetical protein